MKANDIIYVGFQVFSCISRRLNSNNAFSLPEMMRLCDAAYKTKSVVEHVVLQNNMNWHDFLEPLFINEQQFVSGILQVSCLKFIEISFCQMKFPIILNMLFFIDLQMHNFHIMREVVLEGSEVRGLRPGGYWVMKNVVTKVKANCQCAEWSEGLHLLHTFPDSDTIPTPTGKHHLFKKSTCKSKPLVQSPVDLASKMSELRKTVLAVSKLTGFTDEDKDWWDSFFGDRSGMALEQHGVEIAPADPHLVERVTRLFWGDGHVQVGTVRVQPVVVPVVAEVDASMANLAALVTPRTDTIGGKEWGRSRQVGYVVVNEGEDPAVALRTAVAVAKVAKAIDVSDFFRDIRLKRGTEQDFCRRLKVCFSYFCFFYNLYTNNFNCFLRLNHFDLQVGAFVIVRSSNDKDATSIPLPKTTWNSAIKIYGSPLVVGDEEELEEDVVREESDEEDDEEGDDIFLNDAILPEGDGVEYDAGAADDADNEADRVPDGYWDAVDEEEVVAVADTNAVELSLVRF